MYTLTHLLQELDDKTTCYLIDMFYTGNIELLNAQSILSYLSKQYFVHFDP